MQAHANIYKYIEKLRTQRYNNIKLCYEVIAMTDQELMALAEAARENAYTPYSHFRVGAALLCTDGSVYSGCNIENAAYGATICAERAAFAGALTDGKRSFIKIAVCGGIDDTSSPCPPCGTCRQVMREFCDEKFCIILKNGDSLCSYPLAQLLPLSFANENLGE